MASKEFYGSKMKNLAVIYHYFEVNDTYRDNLTFFLNNGIQEDADYYFFISGECTAPLIEQYNVRFIFIENRNHDFGGVSEFSRLYGNLGYEFYIFLNSSMRGPFVPTYFISPWHIAFTSRLSEQTVIIGSSINLLPETSGHSIHFGENFNYKPPYIHVQTTAYALSRKAFNHLHKSQVLTTKHKLDKTEIVSSYEIRISQEIMSQGWSIGALLPLYEQFNHCNFELEFNGTLKNGDPLYKNAFFHRSVHPYETIFIKTNRNMIDDSDLASLTFTSLAVMKKHGSLTQSGQELLLKSYENLSDSNMRRRNRTSVVKRLTGRVRRFFAR